MIKGLSKKYNDKEAVKNISFKVNKNQIVDLGSDVEKHDYWYDLRVVKAY